jgi:uncharacterized membrane protein
MSPRRLVAAATALYALVFFALGVDRYATFHSGADLGIFMQSIDSAFHGFRNTFENGSHFAYHFSPILYLCAPLLWVTHSAIALIAVQAAATALIAPALYAIACRRTSDANAAILACIGLLYPPLQGVTFSDFHETAFIPAGAAWLLWAIDSRRFGAAAAFAAVLLCSKEDQAPALAFVGVAGLVYFARRAERAGAIFSLAMIAASALVFIGYFAIVRPLAGAPPTWHPTHFYDWAGYAHALPPGRQIAGRLTYLLEAFVPLAFIPFRSRVLLLSLPGFAEVLASREPLMYTMGQYYAAVWVPYVLVAFTVAGARLLETGRLRYIQSSAVLCILVSIFFSPLHLGHFLRPLDAQDAATNALIARIPRTASVGTYDEIYAHLGFYPRAQVGLRPEPDWVIASRGYHSTRWDTRILPRLQAALRSGTYRIAAQRDGVVLYERTADASP